MEGKPTYPELTFNDVTAADIDRLREYLTKEPSGSVTDGDSGLAETDCFTAKYKYESSKGILTVEPIHLMPGLRGHRLKRIISAVFTEHDDVDVAGLPTPLPYSCATYNWVVGFIDNQTEFTLTYSGQSTQHGNVISTVNKIAPGATPTQQGSAGAFQNQSPKDSALGCFGSISWGIDGAATMTIDYGVNTLSVTSATVAISGANQGLYSATMNKRAGFHSACAYLYPTVTLTKAS